MVTLNGKQAVTRLIDFEQFGTAFPEILISLGYEDVKVEAKNQAKSSVDYRKQYTPEMRDHIAKVYAEDIAYFKFDF